MPADGAIWGVLKSSLKSLWRLQLAGWLDLLAAFICQLNKWQFGPPQLKIGQVPQMYCVLALPTGDVSHKCAVWKSDTTWDRGQR